MLRLLVPCAIMVVMSCSLQTCLKDRDQHRSHVLQNYAISIQLTFTLAKAHAIERAADVIVTMVLCRWHRGRLMR